MGESTKFSSPPENDEIIKEMADIAFSPEEKTADRLRALGLLSDALSASRSKDAAFKKLDEILNSI
ncbi:MAG: hypothetical protein IJO00_01855 [Clostridia bacterium]|nr:hypothetical protein [Clostridia bacterium]